MKMNKNFNKDTKGYYRLATAWYAKANLDCAPNLKDEIMIGFYPSVGAGTFGEFAIRWLNTEPTGPRLEVYDDAWAVLWHCRDLLAALELLDSQNATPDEIEAKLQELGYKDLTAKEKEKER
jgi:hypothetical protein